MSNLQWKWLGMVALVAVALFALYPSYDWYGRSPEERTEAGAAQQRPAGVLNLGLDLRGGTHLLLEVDVDKIPPDMKKQDAVNQAIEVVRNRVDQFGVSEPYIARQGDRWIVLQLPGISNSAQAKELVGRTALLEFRLVETSAAAQDAMAALARINRPIRDGKPTPEALAVVPRGAALLPGREESYYLVTAKAAVTGALLETARVETGQFGDPIVSFRFNDEGGRKFGEMTGANVGKQLAIVLDGIVYSAPVIRSRIGGGSGIIEGGFDMAGARNLAIVLRAGALPAPISIVEERTVGASLGEDSIRSGLGACAIGIGLIFIFFIVYYRLLGTFAVVALMLNLLLLVAVMAYFGGTLTLPGIAGISLNVAMAVDANVLILERIREELRKGRPLRQAVEAGYDLSASAIFDSNLTVLAASLLLFQFGTGPIKGFALTLTLGNLISMFTATVVTRLMTGTWLSRRAGARKRVWRPMEMFATPRIDWIGKRYWYFGVAAAVVTVALAAIVVRGLNYGIDFTGGTLVEVTYAAPKPLADVRAALAAAGWEHAEPQSFAGTSSFAIRVKGDEALDAQSVDRMVTALQNADPANAIRVDRKEYVGPAVGKQLKQQALLAIGLAIAAIVTYVAFRFGNAVWGAAGIVALVHDVVATVGLLALFQIEVDIVIMAAILTIAGYSINDTIVIFDRMREKMRTSHDSLDALVNGSINETLSRTLLTNANVLAVVLVLFFFGGTVIHDFALVMVVGALLGTYSTVAIATPLIFEQAVRARKRRPRRAEPAPA